MNIKDGRDDDIYHTIRMTWGALRRVVMTLLEPELKLRDVVSVPEAIRESLSDSHDPDRVIRGAFPPFDPDRMWRVPQMVIVL